MKNHDLLRKLADVPFKPFRLKMSNSTDIDLNEPGSVIVGDSSAVLPVETYVDKRGFRIVAELEDDCIKPDRGIFRFGTEGERTEAEEMNHWRLRKLSGWFLFGLTSSVHQSPTSDVHAIRRGLVVEEAISKATPSITSAGSWQQE